MNIMLINNVLDKIGLLPLIFKIDFFGIKIPIICPVTIRRSIEIDLETLIKKFKTKDKEYKYESSKRTWIFLKILCFSVFLFFVCFFIPFQEKLFSEPDQLYVRFLCVLAFSWFAFFWIVHSCHVKVTSQGIYFRRFLKLHFISWSDIQDVTQTGIFWRGKSTIVILKNKNFLNKYIIFPILDNEWVFKRKIEEVTQYIKYKIENSRSL